MNTGKAGTDQAARRRARFFKALGHPMRLNLIQRFLSCCRPCKVSEMQTCCPIDLSVVSRHLGTLREAGILDSEKIGKEVYYSVNAKEVAETLRSVADEVEKYGEAVSGCIDRRSTNE